VLDENLVAWAGLVSGSLHELIGCLAPVSRSAVELCEDGLLQIFLLYKACPPSAA
jgi:hypothetical protein